MRSRALQLLRPLRASAPSSQIPSFTRAASTSTTAAAKPKPATQWKPKARTTTTAAAAPSSKPLPVTDTSTNPVDPQAAISSGPDVSEIDPSLSAAIPTPSFAASLGASNPSAPGAGDKINWASSFHGLSTIPFPPETAAVLMKPLDPRDVEIKPDGIIYLPEIKYRRILNQAFGPGGWGLAPRGELVIAEKLVTREYALVVHGRFVSEARGECGYFSEETIPTAGEGCKSNALMRCCKDLGIASELWDPRYIREFKKTHAHEVWVEHVVNKKRRQVWKLKDADVAYPYKEVKSSPARA